MAQLPRIIITDDDPDDVYLLTRQLAKAGVHDPIVSFRDAESTIAFLERVLPHGQAVMRCALFADLLLPGLGGLELIQWVKSQPTLGELKVFAMSGSVDPALHRKAEALNVDGFILKFPSVEELRAMFVFADQLCVESPKSSDAQSDR